MKCFTQYSNLLRGKTKYNIKEVNTKLSKMTFLEIHGADKREVQIDRKEVISEVGSEKLKKIYTNMIRVRAFDDKIDEMVEIKGYNIPQHSTRGQEATPIAGCAVLNESDYVMPYHRGWAHYIGKGMDVSKMLAEALGKKTGCCRGRGGVQQGDWDKRVMGRPGIQAAHINIAAGIGLAIKLNRGKEVVLSFNGDGSSNKGDWYEGINLAAIWDASVVYVVENNQYAISTPRTETMKIDDIADRAVAFGIPGYIIDGNDAVLAYHIISKAVRDARSGKGPSLIEAKTYRFKGHHAFDKWHDGIYRSHEEIEEMKKRDPIPKLEKELLENNILTEKEIEKIKKEAREEMDKAEEFAVNSPLPTKEELLDKSNLFA